MIPIFQVDAFTCGPFTGNPAGVCLLERPADPVWMQKVAMEMNLSETAFLVPRKDGAWAIQWFTPSVEVELCGHATLASAHVLFERGLAEDTVTFHSRSGLLTARSLGTRVELDFPVKAMEPEAPPEGLLEALGVKSSASLEVGKAAWDYMVVLGSEAEVKALRPDHRALATLPVRGVIATAPSDHDRWDFISRFFAPGSGIDEDPVTGSAHCALARYWGERLKKERMNAFQASERGGEIEVELQGERVLLRGHVYIAMSGELLLGPELIR